MTGLSFKSAVFSLTIVCLLYGSAVAADSYTFTGTATLGNSDFMDFFLSGPSFSIYSAPPGGPNFFYTCSQGTLCTVPAQFDATTPSHLLAAGGLSGGTVGGVTADTLAGGPGAGLTFSGFSFTAGTNPGDLGSGPVTFTGDLTGFAFLPLGCETTCTAVGPQVFDLQLSGSGTGTASGSFASDEGLAIIRGFSYTFQGTATTVPEPSSLLLLSISLIAVFAAIKSWHLVPQVNH